MIDRCVRKDSMVTWSPGSHGVRSQAPVNHMVYFLCHGFIIFIYINKILMKAAL